MGIKNWQVYLSLMHKRLTLSHCYNYITKNNDLLFLWSLLYISSSCPRSAVWIIDCSNGTLLCNCTPTLIPIIVSCAHSPFVHCLKRVPVIVGRSMHVIVMQHACDGGRGGRGRRAGTAVLAYDQGAEQEEFLSFSAWSRRCKGACWMVSLSWEGLDLSIAAN